MLTGDKMETAENIAKSCNLIQPHFHILKYKPPKESGVQRRPKPEMREGVLNGKNENDIETAEYIADFENTFWGYIDNLIKEAEELTKSGIPKALMIEGSELKHIIYEGKDSALME